MIDLLIAAGELGKPQARHGNCLSTVQFSRFSCTKEKPTTTYVLSPLTGAQIDVLYWVSNVGGVPTAHVQLKIPLATATMGHNYAHAGLASIRDEVRCASLLAQITLAVLGFTAEEIEHFRQTTKTQLLELTWHTPTASPRASLNLRMRTKEHFEALQSTRGRHDVVIRDVDYRSKNRTPALLVTTKDGDQFRQYSKPHQVASRTQADRKEARVHGVSEEEKQFILRETKDDTRNEIRLSPNTLKLFGQLHPSSWTPESLKKMIDYEWVQLGFVPQKSAEGSVTLSPEVEATWQRYLAGEDVAKTLRAYTFTRHRKKIKEVKGEDIAIRRKRRAVRSEALGKQLCYDRRRKPSRELRKLVLCNETAPAIIEELRRGLAFVLDKEVPELDGEESRNAWLRKWSEFVDRESGRKVKALKRPPPRGARPNSVPRYVGGIGNAPLPDFIPEDKLIFFEGEGRVI